MQARQQVADGVWALGSSIVNWYVVDDGGRLTAVDSGLPKFEQALAGDLRCIGRGLGDVEAVVLTHSDGDHTGLAAAFRDAGARVLIHVADQGTLAKPRPKSGDGSPRHLVPLMWRPAFWRFMGGMARAGGASPRPVAEPETFSGGDELDAPGGRRRYTPQVTRTGTALCCSGTGACCSWATRCAPGIPSAGSAARR